MGTCYIRVVQVWAAQTMSHIVDSCPDTKFEGKFQLLYLTDNCAVKWLDSKAAKAFER